MYIKIQYYNSIKLIAGSLAGADFFWKKNLKKWHVDGSDLGALEHLFK